MAHPCNGEQGNLVLMKSYTHLALLVSKMAKSTWGTAIYMSLWFLMVLGSKWFGCVHSVDNTGHLDQSHHRYGLQWAAVQVGCRNCITLHSYSGGACLVGLII